MQLINERVPADHFIFRIYGLPENTSKFSWLLGLSSIYLRLQPHFSEEFGANFVVLKNIYVTIVNLFHHFILLSML